MTMDQEILFPEIDWFKTQNQMQSTEENFIDDRLLAVEKNDTSENEDGGRRRTPDASMACENLDSSTLANDNTSVGLLQDTTAVYEERFKKMSEDLKLQKDVVIKMDGYIQGMKKGIGRESHVKKTKDIITILLLATTVLIGYNIGLFRLGKKCLHYVAVFMSLSVVGVIAFGWAAISTMVEPCKDELTDPLVPPVLPDTNASGRKCQCECRYMFPTVVVCLFGIGYTGVTYYVSLKC
ncbi:hypothetical protein AQUCO_00900429v1 [Aquilegia coerulea]|uniref:Uncharacterized protein n=1 Tax=Aquilegia coerulea TaxID=218851 RepID=A0A2G5EDP2_AQUCA|nr:hypothetical protein AQUCO_00900429v1 [Aquilegia coerulea]